MPDENRARAIAAHTAQVKLDLALGLLRAARAELESIRYGVGPAVEAIDVGLTRAAAARELVNNLIRRIP